MDPGVGLLNPLGRVLGGGVTHDLLQLCAVLRGGAGGVRGGLVQHLIQLHYYYIPGVHERGYQN